MLIFSRSRSKFLKKISEMFSFSSTYIYISISNKLLITFLQKYRNLLKNKLFFKEFIFITTQNISRSAKKYTQWVMVRSLRKTDDDSLWKGSEKFALVCTFSPRFRRWVAILYRRIFLTMQRYGSDGTDTFACDSDTLQTSTLVRSELASGYRFEGFTVRGRVQKGREEKKT